MADMKRVTQIIPWLTPIRIWQKRFFRSLKNGFSLTSFAVKNASSESYPYTNKKHQSLLRRKLGDSDPKLQENKITNLHIASKNINGIVIQPGETFSFWKLVGKTSKKKGYIEGMLLSNGQVVTGVGGGICQLANLLYWMALHTPLQVVERHHHSFDPFPDEGRVLPFGSGAGVFYNYVDLQFYNPTDQAFQIGVWLTHKHLKGKISSDQYWPYTYHVFEENHYFYKKKGIIYRTNDIFRNVVDKSTGNKVDQQFLMHNVSEVKYEVDERNVRVAD